MKNNAFENPEYGCDLCGSVYKKWCKVCRNHKKKIKIFRTKNQNIIWKEFIKNER